MSPRSTLPFLVAPILLASASARASDPMAAEALFADAKQLMTQGRYTEACPKLEESQRNDAGLGTQFHLADCWQHLGRTASAWALFREVESEARALGQTSRERVARDRAVALEPWLSKIVIALHDSATAPGLEIRRDGVEVGREQWDVPVPVDPATHVVAVTAPHKQPWQTNVEVLADGKVTTIDVPPLRADVQEISAVQPPPPPAPPVAPHSVPQPPPPTKGATSPMPPGVPETALLEDRGSGQRAIGWTLVGAGVVGLTAGVYFGAQWIDDNSFANSHCVGTCDATGTSLHRDARTQGLRAGALLGGGAAAFLFGAVLVATAPRPHIVLSVADLRIAPVLGPRTGGLAVHGTW
jgi:hypothetical protein